MAASARTEWPDKGAADARVLRQVVRNLLSIAFTAAQIAAGVELVLATTEVAYSAAELWFDPRGDAGWVGSQFRIYALAEDMRVLRGSVTLTSATTPQRLLRVTGGAERWEATVVPAASPSAATKVPIVLVTYEDEASDAALVDVPNLAALATLTGSMGARVRTLRANFWRDPGSTLTPDGITIVAAAEGGNWVRSAEGDPQWLVPDAWTIDAIGGNDENAGGVSTPLKTLAELQRRWGQGGVLAPPSGACTVSIVNSVPASDPLTRIPSVLGGKTLAFQGSPTIVSSGNITTATAPAGNAAWILNAAWSGGVAANLDRRVRITSGANAGNICWIKKDLGANSARVSEPANASVPPVSNVGSAPVLGVIANGDPYAVETCPTIYVDVPACNVDENSFVTFIDLHIGSMGGVGGSAFVYYYQCRFLTGYGPVQLPTESAGAYFLNCNAHPDVGSGFYGGITANPGQIVQVFAGASSAAHEVLAYSAAGGHLVVDLRALAQDAGIGVPFAFGGSCYLGTVRVYDATVHAFVNPTGAGVVCSASGSVTVQANDDTTSFIKGSGHAGAGVFVSSCARMVMSPTAQTNTTVTGTGGDFDLNAGVVALKSINYTTNALTAAINQTWANLTTALGGGGFGGTAVNIATQAAIVSQAANHP